MLYACVYIQPKAQLWISMHIFYIYPSPIFDLLYFPNMCCSSTLLFFYASGLCLFIFITIPIIYLNKFSAKFMQCMFLQGRPRSVQTAYEAYYKPWGRHILHYVTYLQNNWDCPLNPDVPASIMGTQWSMATWFRQSLAWLLSNALMSTSNSEKNTVLQLNKLSFLTCIFRRGFILLKQLCNTSTLYLPISYLRKQNCLFKFVSDTVSQSITVILQDFLYRFFSNQQPIPPAPTINNLISSFFFPCTFTWSCS